MKLWPYHRFEITSPLKREAALSALAAHVEARKWFRWRWPSSGNDKRFEGEITVDEFRITRVMGYRNSFAPTVRGEVHAAGAMSRVVITMRPFVVVIVFAAVWCGAMLSMFGSEFSWMALAMLAFSYLLFMGAFWFEASKQEQALREIFQAI